MKITFEKIVYVFIYLPISLLAVLLTDAILFVIRKMKAIKKIFLCLVAFVSLSTSRAFAQKRITPDTIFTKKVKPATVEMNRKTGKVQRIWFKTVKVKSGFIPRINDSLWLVNGRALKMHKDGDKTNTEIVFGPLPVNQ